MLVRHLIPCHLDIFIYLWTPIWIVPVKGTPSCYAHICQHMGQNSLKAWGRIMSSLCSKTPKRGTLFNGDIVWGEHFLGSKCSFYIDVPPDKENFHLRGTHSMEQTPSRYSRYYCMCKTQSPRRKTCYMSNSGWSVSTASVKMVSYCCTTPLC